MKVQGIIYVIREDGRRWKGVGWGVRENARMACVAIVCVRRGGADVLDGNGE